MKYFLVLFVILLGGLAYVRFEQPRIWNDYVSALKAPEASPSGATASTSETAPEPAPIIRAPATEPEIVSPDSTTFVNPDHVRQVDQPPVSGTAGATNFDAAGTNAPAAPATNAATP